MNVLCPRCQALFRIDPERVPPAGARVRCARCADVFLLTRHGATPLPTATAPAQRIGAGTSPTAPAAPSGHTAAPGPPAPAAARPAAASWPRPAAEAARPAPSSAGAPPAPQRPAAAGPAAVGPAAVPPRRPAFAAQDPDARAQRIARALVSDIVAYHPERREKSLAAGTLRGEFREEIVKSWEEFVAQVGPELARKTPHFRNALNEILARGQTIF